MPTKTWVDSYAKNMNPKNLKIRAKTSVEIDTPYLQINPSSTLSLNVDELGNVKISSDSPLGVKFMGMTVATLSEIEISESGEVLRHSINAPFLVKAQVEREICKAASKIPFSIIETYLRRAGADEGCEVYLSINSDKSIDLKSNRKLRAKNFSFESLHVLPDGTIADTAESVNPQLWSKVKSFLS